MFDFLTRRKYKNQVLGSLHSLLYLPPERKRNPNADEEKYCQRLMQTAQA